MTSAQSLLDRVQSLAGIDALAGDPAQYAAQLAAELPDELEARDVAFAAALQRTDELAARVMRIRLEHALASDSSIGAPTRKVFASTITGYANSLGLLADRVRELAVRGRAPAPDQVADAVVDAARATLALRDAVRERVLALIRERAAAALPEVDARARDRHREDAERKRWSAVRRELEAVAAEPARVLAGPWTARIASWPEQIDEPPAEPEVTFADMIELD